MRRSGRTLGLVAAAALAVLLAACGGDDEAEAEADVGPGAESSEEGEAEDSDAEADDPSTGVRYEVQSGDTLSRIANDFGVTVSDLTEANELEDPDVLHEGQELLIPTP